MHGHQGWNVRHSLCHIYMIYVYIWVVYSFCLFCCLFVIVTTQFVALYKPCKPEMCSERDSPLKRLYRRTHAKLTRLAGSGQLVWAADWELSLALVHARRPAWPGETSETIPRVAPPRKTRPPNHTRVNWPVDVSASGSAHVGPGGRHRSAARVQIGQEPTRQKAREGHPSHYTSLCKPKPKPSTYDPPDNHPLAEIQRPILSPEPKQQICHQHANTDHLLPKYPLKFE